ncbi:hypothetical protein [Leptospira johnsonii]|uniref:Uncharacterized protein n=1 Tax=Leptospira johnsonii TaxID=1917820 RepID=A0A2P2D7X3_9LEPT|nr:hypothetical protein [Leptospira johnsonii]GBF40681.1 hypothetical protein LPTSP1_36990 [Leptospira johnsonii]
MSVSTFQKEYSGTANVDTAFYFSAENFNALSVHAVFSASGEDPVTFDADLDVNPTDDTIHTDTPYLFEIGAAVRLTIDGVGSLPGGLALNTTYYVIQYDIENDLLQLASSYQNALDGIPVDIIGAGEGTAVITPFLVGNFKLQQSDFKSDYELNESPGNEASAGNWIDIPSQGGAVAAGTVIYGSTVVDYQYLRVLIESEGGNVGYSLIAYARGQGFAP